LSESEFPAMEASQLTEGTMVVNGFAIPKLLDVVAVFWQMSWMFLALIGLCVAGIVSEWVWLLTRENDHVAE
jgi:hypothetical protein